MAADTLRFYLDENLPIEIARQLKARGIEAITVRDLKQLGDNDASHLIRATEMGYVLCTQDDDFLTLAASGMAHKGIVFGIQERHYIGAWVKFLALLHAVATPDEMRGHVEYL